MWDRKKFVADMAYDIWVAQCDKYDAPHAFQLAEEFADARDAYINDVLTSIELQEEWDDA